MQQSLDFTNKSEELCVQAIGSISKFLHTVKQEIINPKDYEATYKQLRGLKKFYDNARWDVIAKDVKEGWFIESRKDETFKEYYKLRQEFDKLEVLAR